MSWFRPRPHPGPASQPHPRPPRAAGFSLLEVVVAIGLLSIVIFSALLTVLPISRQTRLSTEMEIAISEARNILERVQVVPFNELLDTYPQGTSLAIDELPQGEITINYEDPAADPRVLEVTVSWSSPEIGPMSTEFHTVRTE